jgi:hypothetical protein
VSQIWIFAGGDDLSVAAPPQSDSIAIGMNSRLDCAESVRQILRIACNKGHIMRSVKTIVTFAALASSVLVVSWVGLALLGF